MLIISVVVISPDDSEGVVLVEVMKEAKEIRSDGKKRVKAGVKTPINRRAGWGAGRLLAFLGWPEMQGGRAAAGGGAVGGFQGGGAMVCRGWLGGGDSAAICGGDSAVFNQQLTTFLVVAMVRRFPVFFLCSYWQFRRGWRLSDLPGARRGPWPQEAGRG